MIAMTVAMLVLRIASSVERMVTLGVALIASVGLFQASDCT